MNFRSFARACRLLLGAAGFFVRGLLAQDYPPPPPPPPSDEAAGQLQQLPPLEQLLAPIALYPDPVIALILPSSTLPDQLQAAAANPSDPNFDPSIQGLEHYPEVLRWMAANAIWTQQLGGEFANAPSEVMNAIQSLRRRAQAAGTLVPSSFEQIVVDADGQIEILPSNPTQIYLPSYNPEVVYWGYPGGYPRDYFGWSRPYAAGAWLTFDFDWGSHALWHGDWYDYHREYGWNRRPDFERWHREGGRDDNRGREWRGAEAWHAPANHPARPDFRGDRGDRERSGASGWQGRPGQDRRIPSSGQAPAAAYGPRNYNPPGPAAQAYGPRGYVRPDGAGAPPAGGGRASNGGYSRRDGAPAGGGYQPVQPRGYPAGGPGERQGYRQSGEAQAPGRQQHGEGQPVHREASPQRGAPSGQASSSPSGDREHDHQR